MTKFPTFFVTGTDTGIGKTHISQGMLQAAKCQQMSTLGIKPLASGAIFKAGRYYSQDALALQAASTVILPYDVINPFLFQAPVAPHIEAEKKHQPLSVSTLIAKTQMALAADAAVKVIEGIGGWCMPLNGNETMADFVIQGNFAVVFVVGIRLGCLNHAILTAKAFRMANITPLFWVANLLEPASDMQAENINMLKQWLPYPYLGAVSFNQPATPLFVNFFQNDYLNT